MWLWALVARGFIVDFPSVQLEDPPTDLAQLAQVVQLERELAHVTPRPAADAKLAGLNLYGNYTLTQIPPPHAFQNFIVGLRVQVINGEMFYGPAPAEVAGWLTTAPERYKGEFAAPAAHALFFMRETLAKHKVPDVDVTFVLADFCFDVARIPPEVWGLGMTPVAPPNSAPAAIATPTLPPVLAWNSAQSGWKTCNALTTTSYDWTWPGAMPGVYEGPVWEQRQPKLMWRGSLIGSGLRARLVRLGLSQPELDLKIAGGFDCGKYVQETTSLGGSTADCPHVTGPFVELAAQQSVKFIVDVDGGASTWRFKSLLGGGWTIFKVDSAMYQFWYPQLVPYVHYIPVDAARLEEDLPAKYKWALAHDAECKAMAIAAKQFALEHLTWDKLHWHQYAALRLFASKFVGPLPPDPNLARFCCKDLTPWPHLTSVPGSCIDTPACQAEPPRPGLVKEEWRAAGAVSPTAFPPWWTVPTQAPTTPLPSFLRR